MLFTSKWLSQVFPVFNGRPQEDIPINAVVTDSRKEIKNSLFIPLIGENFDGHDYVLQAIEHGAAAVIWQASVPIPADMPANIPVFLVDDTLHALQELAALYRLDINPAVIGITGSNGKTTTKDITAAVMKSAFKTHSTKGNFNNHIGVPLTILSMPRDTEVLILEMGMNHFGEIEHLSTLAKPDYAIITNIGESHIEYLGSREGIAKAKQEILIGLKAGGKLIIDGDEELLQPLCKQDFVIPCGFGADNRVIIDQVAVQQDHTVFRLHNDDVYQIPLLGSHHAKNASYAITLGNCMGITHEKMKMALENIELTSMRFEIITGQNGVSIINDAYNASPTSMKAAIEVVKQMTGYRNKLLVLGDVLELGSFAKELHQSVAAVIDDPITAVYTIGEHAGEITDAVKKDQHSIVCHHYVTRDALLADLKANMDQETIILFKASRGMRFEKILEQLI